MNLDEYVDAIQTKFSRLRGGPLIIQEDNFQRVLRWHEMGIPLFVVIDTLDEIWRRAAEGKRKRPPRTLGYCEPAIVEAFEEWRERQAGARAIAEARPGGDPERRELFDRAADAVRASEAPEPLRTDAAGAIAALAADAGRGDVAAALDARLLAACLDTLPSDARAALESEASAEIAPFAASMKPDVRDRAVRAAIARRVRSRFRLPDLTLLPL